MDQQGAALPWATAQQQEAQEAEASVVPDLPAALGIGLQTRVEVLWALVDEDGASTTKWWGAELQRRAEGQTDGEGRAVYVLRYDPDPEMGFGEHEECSVTFLEEHFLYDLALDDELPWRRAGEAWQPPESPAGLGAAGEDGEGLHGEVYSLSDIAADIRRSERRRGRTLDEEAAEMLSELPQQQQMAIAAGFRSFSDHLTAAIVKLQEQHGSDYIVTADDVKSATAAAKAALQRGM